VEFSEWQFRHKVKLERPIKRAKTATDKEEIIEIMQATQEPFLKLAELWHAATGRRPEEIFALRHCGIDTKRRKFRLAVTGSLMMASAGLNGSLKSCAALSLSCMIGGCCWSLLFCCSSPASLTPSYPPMIGLPIVIAALALALAAVVVVVVVVLILTLSRAVLPLPRALLWLFLSLGGWNYPTCTKPPSPR
jgi:hypothetical protein